MGTIHSTAGDMESPAPNPRRGAAAAAVPGFRDMDCPNPKRGAAAAAVPCLPEDAIVEILARVPVRSIHRFKCVSQRWCDIISDPVNRKRLPQTLEGFFRINTDGYGQFISLPGITAPLFDPSTSFLTKLPGNKNIRLLHSCNGLLLFGHCTALKIGSILDSKRGYIVCNPATEQWMAVPSTSCPSPSEIASTYVVFDPAISPLFHLVHLWENGNLGMIEVHIYSSESGVWVNCTSKQRRWQEGGRWKLWLKGTATYMATPFSRTCCILSSATVTLETI